jgi:hypothetical protein
MRATMRFLGAAVTALGLVAGSLSAQVSVPNIRKPIDAAKSAAAKTSAQIRTSEQAGSVASPSAEMTAQGTKASAQGTKAPAGKAPAGGSKAPAKAEQATVSEAGRQGATLTVMREAFAYNPGDRRDPFVSLMASGELRPVVTDLVLTGVIYDETGRGRGSIAMLVDNSTGKTYSVSVGTQLARMRVARIGRESVTFDIDEFGLSRSETLVIDKTKAGAPAPRRP